MAEEKSENFFERFRLNIDPDHLDENIQQLGDRLRKTVETGRYTRVRLLYKGKAILPDIPMAAMLAGEVATFWLAGPLKAVVFNLGIKSFIEVVLIHEADELVQQGIELYLDGDVEAAEARYREALAKKMDDTSALYNLGVLLRVTGRKEEAIQCLEKAAKDELHADGGRAREALNKLQQPPRVM